MVQRDTVKESDVETSVYFNNSSYGTLTKILRKIYQIKKLSFLGDGLTVGSIKYMYDASRKERISWLNATITKTKSWLFTQRLFLSKAYFFLILSTQ